VRPCLAELLARHDAVVRANLKQFAGEEINTARDGFFAAPAEVLVSGTTRDLVAGSGLEFEDRGSFELKGVGLRTLYAATA
jgi:class 3 adenylate cyclase